MQSATYQERRGELEVYFDRTAVDAWKQMTSDAPLSKIRATVRAGRDQMRQMILDWLPGDLSGRRVLDAGCGTGALAVEIARRGAHVVAVDLSPKLVGIARERMPTDLEGQIEFIVGDMVDVGRQTFDHTVAMDSLIHYRAADIGSALEDLAALTGFSLVFTFAPKTPALAAMHGVGKLFPRSNRSPAIQPVGVSRLRRLLDRQPGLEHWLPSRTERVSSGFYTSQAMELRNV